MRKLLVAAALVVAPLTVTAPAQAADEAACTAADTPVVLEHGPLDGEDAVLCAKDVVGESGLDALEAAGLSFDLTTGTAPMVCRVEGRPTPQQESCRQELDGEGYWAFLVAEEDGEWGYASTGMGEHVVEEGQFLALVHAPLSAGEDTTVTAQAAPTAETRAAAVVPAGTDAAGDESAAEEGWAVSPGTVAGLVVVLLVLVLAAVVLVRRRRAARP